MAMWRSPSRDQGRKRYEIGKSRGQDSPERSVISDDGLITVSSMHGVALVFLGMTEIRERQADLIQDKLMAVADSAAGRVAVSLAAVAALTSSGINALVAVHTRCAKLGGHLALFAVPHDIVDMIRITRLDRALLLADNASQAVESFAQRKGLLAALGFGRPKRDAA